MLSLIPVQYRLAAALLLAIGCYAAGGWTAWRWKTMEAKAAQAEAIAETIKVERQQALITADIARASAYAEAGIHTVTMQIIKEVPRYVSRKADAACVVPRGFVLVHDAAARNLPVAADATGESYDTPGGVALSDVASTVADNYDQCNTWRNQVIWWQEWARRHGLVTGEP